MFDIKKFLNLEGYTTDIRLARRTGSKSTQEFFTPYSIVKHMCDKVSEEDWADPNKTFLEPCMGNAQFVLMILYRRIHEYNIHWRIALERMFALELMEDNVQEGRARIHELLRNIAPEYDPKVADEIMDKNIVVHDFFTWNFQEWRPYTEEELKNLHIKKKMVQ